MAQPPETASTNRANCMLFNQSLRDLQYGVHMSAAFVFSILFAFSSTYGKNLQSQWLISVLATLVIFTLNLISINFISQIFFFRSLEIRLALLLVDASSHF